MAKPNILITGASGFLGKYILDKLLDNSNVFTLGRKHITSGTEHHQWEATTIPDLKDTPYKKVIHIAGKAHSVPVNEIERQAFFDVNVKGTTNLLAGLNRLTSKPQQIILISSVAIYGKDAGTNISENQVPQPTTPYGKSKLEAEQEIIRWCQRNNCTYLILRLPLIAGVDPPGNLGAMKKAIEGGKYPRIKNNPARKSIVLAEDVASLIAVTEQPSGIYNLTDGIHPKFIQVEEAIEKRTGKKVKIILPFPIVKTLALLGDLGKKILQKDLPISSEKLHKITSSLTFDDSKARKELGWNPQPVLPFIEKHI